MSKQLCAYNTKILYSLKDETKALDEIKEDETKAAGESTKNIK